LLVREWLEPSQRVGPFLLVIERGEGAWLIATNGERYLDFTSGVAVNALGHAHPHLVAAITEQLDRLHARIRAEVG